MRGEGVPTAILLDGRKIDFLPDAIGEGGMKRVYLTTDKRSVVCFFKDRSQAADPKRRERLEAILGKYNPTTDAVTGKYFADLFCWPSGMIVQPELGVLAPAYPKNFFFATGPWQGKEKEGTWFCSPKLRKMLPEGERGPWKNYIDLCLLMARAVRKLHLTGLAHSDLSRKNVLVDPPGGRCAVIDIDSLVVPGLHPPDVLGTPGFIAPEVIATQHLPLDDKRRKLPSNLTDLHALAVLIYEHLLRRHPLRGPKVNGTTAEEDEMLSMGPKALFIENPHDSSNRPEGITRPFDQFGPYLPKVIYKAFVEGLHQPAARPGADDWENALLRSLDLLVQCGNASCDEKGFLYSGEAKPRCPWCSWELKDPIPVLEFFYSPAGRRGQFRAEGYSLVGADRKPLYQWHVFRNVRQVEGVTPVVQAMVVYQQGQWGLLNCNLSGMVSPAGTPVDRGKACILRDGDEVLLSKDDHARLVSVKMIPE
jgi:serine/threonine protein kinase